MPPFYTGRRNNNPESELTPPQPVWSGVVGMAGRPSTLRIGRFDSPGIAMACPSKMISTDKMPSF